MPTTHLLKTEAARLAGARAWATNLLILVVFGVGLPLLKGLNFFDPLILGAYTCLGAVFASPAAASNWAEPGVAERSLATAQARIVVCVAYGEAMALGMTALGIATVYFSHLGGLFFLPALDSLMETAVFGLVLTVALSTMAVWLTLRYSAGVAKLLLRMVFLGLLASFFLLGRYLFSGFVWQISGFALAAGIGFWIALRATFRPESG
jgi:hypothetical protein